MNKHFWAGALGMFAIISTVYFALPFWLVCLTVIVVLLADFLLLQDEQDLVAENEMLREQLEVCHEEKRRQVERGECLQDDITKKIDVPK